MNLFPTDNDDNIRPPDEVIMEQLVQDKRTDFDKQVDEALYQSLKEFTEENEMNEQYEEQLINSYAEISKERKEKFKDLLTNMRKVMHYDKEVKEINDMIEPIIDAYCSNYIENVELDAATYNKIFTILKTIRKNEKNIELLKTIIYTTIP